MKAEIKDEVLQETREEIRSAAAPEWTNRIRFGGDIRLRYQRDFFDRNNALMVSPSESNATTLTLMNTRDDQERFRVRARLGATVDVAEGVEAGVRLTTGDTSNPVSSNQTMGTYFNKYGTVFDLAYLKLNPYPGSTLIGGRILNPWFFTDLVWARDLTFEGFAGTYRKNITPMFEPFVTLGAFPLYKDQYDQKDKWLYAGQVGTDIRFRKDLVGKIGVAYYDYQHVRGIANPASNPNEYDYTAPTYQQKGNTIFDISASPTTYTYALAAQYQELDITSMLDIGFWDPVHVVLMGDYVNNIGFDRQSVVARTGNPATPAQTQGYQTGLAVGYPETVRFGQWRVYGYYRYLEADAVLDAFTDPDFHLGGTNAKGWIVGADFGLYKNVWLEFKYTTANEISGPPLSIDSLFLDLNAKF